MAAALLAPGSSRGAGRIASATRIEWLCADLAIMCAGAAMTTVYPSTGPEDVAFIISGSGTRLVFAEEPAPDRQAARPARPHTRRHPLVTVGPELRPDPRSALSPGGRIAFRITGHPWKRVAQHPRCQPQHLAERERSRVRCGQGVRRLAGG